MSERRKKRIAGQTRMIYAKIWESEDFALELQSLEARLLYIATITLADHDGILRGNAMFLKSKVFPYDEKIKRSDVKSWLAEIVKSGLLQAYEVDEVWYLYHPNWDVYQTIRKEYYTRTRFPIPPQRKQQDSDYLVTPKERKGKEYKGKESKEQKTPTKKKKAKKVKKEDPKFLKFWDVYPLKKAKGKARESWDNIDSKHYDTIIADIPKRKSKDTFWIDGKIPYPSTYLNQERWEDDITDPSVENKTKRQAPEMEKHTRPDGSTVMRPVRMNTHLTDKARAYDKRQQALAEDREREENAKDNEKLRDISNLSKELSDKMSSN